MRDVALDQWAVASVNDDRETIRRRLVESEHGSVLILDEESKPLRWIGGRDLARETENIGRVGLPVRAVVEPQATLRDALDEMITSTVGCAVVIDGRGRYQGIVDMGTIMKAVDEMRASARARDRAAAEHGLAASSPPEVR